MPGAPGEHTIRRMVTFFHDVEQDLDNPVDLAACRDVVREYLALEKKYGIRATYNIANHLIRYGGPAHCGRYSRGRPKTTGRPGAGSHPAPGPMAGTSGQPGQPPPRIPPADPATGGPPRQTVQARGVCPPVLVKCIHGVTACCPGVHHRAGVPPQLRDGSI